MEKEKQIKSKKRVKKFAEVFTAEREVKAMVDLIPNITPQMTFLEPSCGTGNFLIEILERKLKLYQGDKNATEWATHIIDCYASLYGVDIQKDNVEECKERLLSMNPLPSLNPLINITLDENIIVGDWLEMQGLSKENGYKEIKKKK